jgi:hypothetical protein
LVASSGCPHFEMQGVALFGFCARQADQQVQFVSFVQSTSVLQHVVLMHVTHALSPAAGAQTAPLEVELVLLVDDVLPVEDEAVLLVLLVEACPVEPEELTVVVAPPAPLDPKSASFAPPHPAATTNDTETAAKPSTIRIMGGSLAAGVRTVHRLRSLVSARARRGLSRARSWDPVRARRRASKKSGFRNGMCRAQRTSTCANDESSI